jgi:hypothetical protein
VQVFDHLFDERFEFNESLAHWNTSSAISMAYMFNAAQKFDQDLAHFDMSRVTNTKGMFKDATSYKGAGIAGWDVSNNEVRKRREPGSDCSR